MYTYKLTRIKLNDGSEIIPGKITVILGPNNAGKSRALKDIAWKTTKEQALKGIVVTDVDWTYPQNLQELHDSYDLKSYQDENGNLVFRTLTAELGQEYQFYADNWSIWNDQKNFQDILRKPQFAQHFGSSMVAFLTTESRLQLVKESPSASHERQQANLLQALYNAGISVESDIQQLVKLAFGKEIKLDFTVPQRLLFRVGDNFSQVPPDPRDARPIINLYAKLDEQGDGIRSFVGILTSLLTINRNLFLIDEPEAFLHPPQAFRIGEFIAQQANSKRQIILATHSADLLRGLLSKTTDVTILRIDRRNETNYFHKLDTTRLQELVNDPLLSSARVLDGLFYPGVVVVEADSDARFYHIASNKRRNNIDFHFVNADNKQTVPKILTMYRDLGVRCAGIVDFDVLNDKTEFETQLQSLKLTKNQINELLLIREKIAKEAKEIPPNEKIKHLREEIEQILNSLNQIQAELFSTDQEAKSRKNKYLKQIDRKLNEIQASTKSWKEFKEKGRLALSEELQPEFDQLWNTCIQQGLFINPCGELESMLTEQGIQYTTHKRGWITQALQLLPKLEVNDDEYPWQFIKQIQNYLLE